MKSYDSVMIVPAEQGGYVVYNNVTSGYERQLLFAGTLVATLAYLQRRYTPPKKAARS